MFFFVKLAVAVIFFFHFFFGGMIVILACFTLFIMFNEAELMVHVCNPRSILLNNIYTLLTGSDIYGYLNDKYK